MRFLFFVVACFSFVGVSYSDDTPSEAKAAGRKPWTSSRIVGAPEPPLELELQPAFPKLHFNDSMHIRWQPDLKRYFVIELSGKIWSFEHDLEVAQADLAVDLKADLKSFDSKKWNGVQEAYTLVFDPAFAKNRFVYVCIVLGLKNGKDEPTDGVQVSRFTVTKSDPPTIDVSSELKIISWRGGGHNGCDMDFDHSGCLLISAGDATAPSPPDMLRTGQDVTDLLASIMRIDVRGATQQQPYKIPDDNPFVKVPNVRPEIWAFGFRNPWRIDVDPSTNDVWVGDVGWEKWELVHRVQKGGNYGWSIREGFELIQPDSPQGPGPILPPRVALPHTESASVTGGVVYRGSALPTINDHYLFGDWVNGRIWAVSTKESSPEREVASGPIRIIAFGLDRDGLPLVVNHLAKTTLYRLVANPNYKASSEQNSSFPTQLSQTGLFEDTARQIPSQGVRPFSINQSQWSDGATSKHYLALPELTQLQVFDAPQPFESLAMFSGRLHFPVGTVLAKTISWKDHPIETQVLHHDGRLWRAYSYVWNAQRTDAVLAPASGMELELPESEGQRWTIHGRSTCLQCHNPWSNFSLALTPEQLHQKRDDGQLSELQLLVRQGYLQTLNAAKKPIAAESVVSQTISHSTEGDLEFRARSYLHVNCAHCHQMGAGSGVALSLKFNDKHSEMNCFGLTPSKGQFEIPDGQLISAGDPLRSVLLYRMASSTIGRMPHVGSREIDTNGTTLIAEWISSLSSESPNSKQPVEARSAVEQSLAEALKRATNRNLGQVETSVDMNALSYRVSKSPPLESSLLEGFLPSSKRSKRLSPSATFSDIGSLVGDKERGHQLFLDKSRLQCANCHRTHASSENTAIATIDLGPDLSSAGLRLNAQQLFEAIAEPNRQIEARYQATAILRHDGRIVIGIIQSESEKEVELKTSTGERIKIPAIDIDERQATGQSIMPSGIAQQLTAQEMSDLIAYLLSQKAK
jgi:putative heme-binding domain-containing protein